MNGEEAVNVFDLVRKEGNLPAKIDELVPLSFIGTAAVKFYKAKVEAMKQLGIAEGQRAATLRDGQDAGECLLRIEARIGELYNQAPNLSRATKEKKSTPVGRTSILDRHRGPDAVAIHRHPEAVERVIKEARENEDIPTKTAVLKEIQLQKVKEAQKDKIPENQRIKSMLGEEEFAEWTSWVRIRTSIKQRANISEMSSRAREEIIKVLSGIRMDIENFLEGVE